MKKIIGTIILAVFIVSCGWADSSRLNSKNYEQILPGMSQSQVEVLLWKWEVTWESIWWDTQVKVVKWGWWTKFASITFIDDVVHTKAQVGLY